MKIIAFVCALFIFSFSSQIAQNFVAADVKSCAYSEKNEVIAIYDAANSLKIIGTKDLKLVNKFDFKTDEITSLAFGGANLYAGFSGGEIVKFSEDFSSFAPALNLSNLSLDAQITHLQIADGKIYAIAGKNKFISYDIASKKLTQAELSGVYRVAARQILKDVALITGWDRSVFAVNLSSMKVKNLGKFDAVALSAAELNSQAIFGLASGEIASVKFDANGKLTNENLKSKQTGAANSTAEVNLSDKMNASANSASVKNTQNKVDSNLPNGKTNANLANSKTKSNLNVQIYKISNSRVKSLLVSEGKIYIGLDNGEILRSDANFAQIEKIGQNSDSVVKIFKNNKKIIAVSINGEIKIYEIKS